MDNIFHDSLVQCHLHIGITVIPLRFHDGIRTAQHMAYQGQGKSRRNVSHQRNITLSFSLHIGFYNGHAIIFMKCVDVLIVSCLPKLQNGNIRHGTENTVHLGSQNTGIVIKDAF